MKQVILITAYKDFEHLQDMVSCFNENFSIYIHIDKKSKVNEKLVVELSNTPSVKLVSRKYYVNWGGINHLKSILYLAEQALKDPNTTVFHLISGHDFPIKKASYFINFFENNTKDYISYFELPSNKWPNGGLDRLEYYNLYDLVNAKKYRTYINKFVELQKTIGLKRPLNDLPKLYGGDTWWTLTRRTLQYVINYTSEHRFLLKRLKYSFCSEEIYFQTVIMNSEYSENVVNNCLRYIDWKKRNGNFPANLDIKDLEPIQSSNYIFARKFSFPVSEELKVKIKSNLL